MAAGTKKRLFGEYWQVIAAYCISIVGLGFLLFWRLGSLLPWLSREEATATSISSFSQILANPLFWPQKVLVLLANSAAPGSVFWLRFSSAVFGLLLVVMFFLLMRKWFDVRIAYIATLLLATSSWFLTYARMATPHILVALAVMAMLTCAWWLRSTSKPGFSLLTVVIVIVLCLYIPGIIWIVGLALLFRIKNVREQLRNISVPLKMTAAGIGLLLLLPLIRALILDSGVALEFLSWPVHFNLVSFTKEFFYVPFSLMIQSDIQPAYNLGRLPLLDVFTSALLLLGAYTYLLKIGLVRTKVLLAFGLLCSVLIALENPIRIIILIPVIYAIIAGGLTLLTQQWFSVFPTNPIPKVIGTVLVTVVIGATCFYHLNRYFVAWTQAPATRAVYTHEPRVTR